MNAATEGPAVVLDGVTKRYGPILANDRLSLEIATGEFFSFLGPSGCGKTTLLRAIAGFIAPDAGRILIGGRDVSDVPANRRPTNLVFQDYALFPHLDVAGNVGFGLREAKVPRGEIRDRVASALESVQLGGLERRKPEQLSGGQQQRVALARALINRPVVLLLDEPLGALDLRLRRAMQLELKRIQREVGITFIYVTHDQEEAMTMSDRIAVMHAGRFEQVGTPEQIYERPTNLFVASFIGEANLLPVTVTGTGDQHADVRLGTGTVLPVSGLPGSSVRTGEARTLLVRPEEVELSTSEPTRAALGLPATLVEAIYQGANVRYEARLRDGTTLVSLTPRAERPTVGVGDDVWVWWAPDAGALLDAGDIPSALEDPAPGSTPTGDPLSGQPA